jgi:hypothetical protein
MLALRELQVAFSRALLGNDAAIAERVLANGLDGARRLQIYRNNCLASLGEALAAVYPVVHRLVGESYFRQVAREYVRCSPSTSGNLHAFGGDFPTFLGQRPEAQGLPYLADVGRLEWAWHEVLHEAEHPPLDLAALAEVPAHRQVDLRLRLHPASRLLQSPYPVLRIWEVNQDDYGGNPLVDLREGESRVLVARRAGTVQPEALSAGAWALLSALARGCSLALACEAGLAEEPGMDLQASLAEHVRRGTIVDFQ